MEHPLTHERLKELFGYNPETGLFTRLVALAKSSYVGEVAGTLDPKGYIVLGIDYKLYLGHRLAWFYMTGEWPSKHIDHIDGVRSNNCFANLREASVSENAQNVTKSRKDSKSGFLGVFKHGVKWTARITINGKTKHLGLFTTPELASEAYVAAKREFHSFGML